MKVFLTGASGFIGKAVLERLIKEKYEITVLLLPDESEDLVKGPSIVRGDVTEPSTLSGKMKKQDVVIHLAGSVGFQSWKNCISINRNGTQNVIREVKNSGIQRFIHISSVSVYGRVPDIHIDENFPFKKIGDPYGDTKIDGENIVNEFARQNKIDLTIIRPTAVYGKGDNKFLPSLVRNLKSGKFRIVGDGNNTVDLINVSDVADFILLVLREDKSIGSVYNLANPDNPTWNEMLEAVTSDLGIPMPKKHISYKVAYAAAGMMELISKFSKKSPRLSRYAIRLIGQQYNYVIDRMKQELGFTPAIGLLDGMRECLKEIKN